MHLTYASGERDVSSTVTKASFVASTVDHHRMRFFLGACLLLACCGQACRGAARRATFVPPVFQGSASQGKDAVCIVAASEKARVFLATLPSTASSRACSVRQTVSAGAGHDEDDFAHMNIRVAPRQPTVAGGEAGGSREQVAQALAG